MDTSDKSTWTDIVGLVTQDVIVLKQDGNIIIGRCVGFSSRGPAPKVMIKGLTDDNGGTSAIEEIKLMDTRRIFPLTYEAGFGDSSSHGPTWERLLDYLRELDRVEPYEREGFVEASIMMAREGAGNDYELCYGTIAECLLAFRQTLEDRHLRVGPFSGKIPQLNGMIALAERQAELEAAEIETFMQDHQAEVERRQS